MDAEQSPDRNPLERHAADVISACGFNRPEKIYDASPRAIIYSGIFEGKPAVLKLYQDERPNDEPRAQQYFLVENQSTEISAPEVYASEMESFRSGWLIMERLEGGEFLTHRPTSADRSEFVDLYEKYRTAWPETPHRPLMLAEELAASDYHAYRIYKWLRAGTEADAERARRGEEPVLRAAAIRDRFERAMTNIHDVYRDESMSWGHGHLKPKDVYRTTEGRYYLTDFAHTKMHPTGYEPAFIIWSDAMIGTDWKLRYEEWRKPIDEWTELFRKSDEFAGKDYDRLMQAALLERSLGVVFNDIAASDHSPEEREARLALMYQLIDDLLT